jgi:hypothetical protein
MKQKVVSILIAMSLLAGPAAICAAGQEPKSVDEIMIVRAASEPGKSIDEIKERAAQAQTKGTSVVIKVRKGAKVFIGANRFRDQFAQSASLTGKIKQMREEDFTLTSGKPGKDEFAMVVSYADVLSIRHPSAFEKALKGVGRFSFGVAGGALVLPIYGILALLGKEPEC